MAQLFHLNSTFLSGLAFVFQFVLPSILSTQNRWVPRSYWPRRLAPPLCPMPYRSCLDQRSPKMLQKPLRRRKRCPCHHWDLDWFDFEVEIHKGGQPGDMWVQSLFRAWVFGGGDSITFFLQFFCGFYVISDSIIHCIFSRLSLHQHVYSLDLFNLTQRWFTTSG